VESMLCMWNGDKAEVKRNVGCPFSMAVIKE